MLGREAKIPANFSSKISKEGVDFVNKVPYIRFSYCKEPLESVLATTALAKF